ERMRVHGNERINVGTVFVIGRYPSEAGGGDGVHGECTGTIGCMDVSDGGLFNRQGADTGDHRGTLRTHDRVMSWGHEHSMTRITLPTFLFSVLGEDEATAGTSTLCGASMRRSKKIPVMP